MPLYLPINSRPGTVLELVTSGKILKHLLMSMPIYPILLEEGQEVYEAAETMDKLPTDRHHYLPASCVQLGPQKNTVLHLATSYGHHEIVKLVCEDLPYYVAERDARGDTALHIAARAGDTLIVTWLIYSDLEDAVLSITNEEGNTALHEALVYHHENVARILIDKNRDMTYSVNKEGKSLLYLAAEAGYVDIIRLLMDNPVGNYAVDGRHTDKSPVHAAIFGRNIDVLKLLWKDQESFWKRCANGRNPLHYAAHIGYTQGADFLLKKHVEETEKIGLEYMDVEGLKNSTRTRNWRRNWQRSIMLS